MGDKGHSVTELWQYKNIESSAFMESWSANFKMPTGRARRLIVLHIGGNNGFA